MSGIWMMADIGTTAGALLARITRCSAPDGFALIL